MTARYPLTWPAGWKRTPASERQPARFHSTKHSSFRYKSSLTLHDAIGRLSGELDRLGIHRGLLGDDALLSTNVRTRLDGLPRSDDRAPDDPGVAAYFRLKGKDRVLACDRWTTVAGNIAAIAAHIGALRGIDRWGVGSVEQAFAGYDALPPPGPPPARPWRSVLCPGWPASDLFTRADAEAAYRTLAAQRHPDRGGTHEQMSELNAAIAAARKELP